METWGKRLIVPENFWKNWKQNLKKWNFSLKVFIKIFPLIFIHLVSRPFHTQLVSQSRKSALWVSFRAFPSSFALGSTQFSKLFSFSLGEAILCVPDSPTRKPTNTHTHPHLPNLTHSRPSTHPHIQIYTHPASHTPTHSYTHSKQTLTWAFELFNLFQWLPW